MNFSSIFSEIEKLDPEVYERTSLRRSVIKTWTRRVTAAALPFALGSLFQKAYGKGTATIVEILNFALTLEYLESSFYEKGLDASRVNSPLIPLIPSGLDQSAIRMIADHEGAHVRFLTQTIRALQGVPVATPKFDYTGGKGSGGGPFADVFKNYDTFLAVSQAFEDTGVRAYKGQAPGLITDNAILTAALRIHSVEARHAAHIRKMRRQTPGPSTDGQDIKSWITGNNSNINGGAADASYKGEELTVQAGTEIVNISGFKISAAAASESFDEPLSMADVLAIVDPFIVP